MTEVQVEVAKTYLEHHMEKFGFQAPNVTFLHGRIEKLAEAGIQNPTVLSTLFLINNKSSRRSIEC
uniref:Arsenite methyltransferase n=1 Tax=Mus musculus TaxID=10090 RepID=A0A494B9D3_MOUSE